MGNRSFDILFNNEKNRDYKFYNLSSIKKLLELSGDPQKKFKSIHVAGTNGKGSVCMMLSSIFVESGYRTGLYTSPHLLRENERIRINDRDIDDSDLNFYKDKILSIVESENIQPTYFDALTAAAFAYFADMGVDIAIIETGLGGRLDSTNVVTPLCSIITDISRDHENILGDTLTKIAAEKAGIIKKGIPVITSNTADDILTVLKNEAEKLKSQMYVLGKEFVCENIWLEGSSSLFDYEFTKSKISIKGIRVNHPGLLQAKNSSISATAALLLQEQYKNITHEKIKDGIEKTNFIGRFQKLSAEPEIYFDPAHNIQAAESLRDIMEIRFKGRDVHVILSVMADKNYLDIISIFKKRFNVLYYALQDSRAFAPDADIDSVSVIRSFDELRKYIACKSSGNAVFVFTGTFRIYSTAIQIINSGN